MDARLLPRGLAPTLPAARADTPVVCLLGRRQCGKTTLVRTLVPGHGYVTFDDEVWPERVIPKCATDRSLAIARGLDAIFWRVGDRIRQDILQEMRAEYGEQIVATLSQHLTGEFGRGWDRSAISRAVRFSEVFPDPKIVSALSTQLGWSHFVELLPLKKHEVRPGEEAPIGLILCAEKSDERFELFELESRGVRIAKYLTELPPKDFLARKLHDAVRLAQARLEAHSLDEPTTATLPTPSKAPRRKRRS